MVKGKWVSLMLQILTLGTSVLRACVNIFSAWHRSEVILHGNTRANLGEGSGPSPGSGELSSTEAALEEEHLHA